MNQPRQKILIANCTCNAVLTSVPGIGRAMLLLSFSLVIGISVNHPDVSAQDFSRPQSSDAAGQSGPTFGSNLYFQDTSPLATSKSASPQRDPRSVTPPSIPATMQQGPGNSQTTTKNNAGQDSRSIEKQPAYQTAFLPTAQNTNAPQFVEPINNSNTPPDSSSFLPRIDDPRSFTEPANQPTAKGFNAPYRRPTEPAHYDPRQLSIVAGMPSAENPAPQTTYNRDEPQLELPSNLQMADPASPQHMEVQSREMFWDQFSTMPADKKHHTEGYDSLPAILNNGFWFGGVDIMFIEPIFQGNNVITTTNGVTSNSVPADYNFAAAWKGYFGFETNAGPAVKASFFRYNEFSGAASFISDGATSGESIVHSGDPANVFRLAATSAGDRMDTRQQIKLNSIDLLFYKDQKNPVSRVRGNVGMRFLSLQQFLFADLFDAAGPVTSIRSVNDYQAMGPKLGIEYFRPIGHSDLELQSGLFGSLMFGRRDHTVTDVGNMQFRQLGKIEPLSIFEMYLGVQWNFQIARCQTGFVRTALESQYWSGSDSPGETDTDFGFYGLTAGFGIQR